MTSPPAHTELVQRALIAFQRGSWNEAAALCEQVTRQYGEDANACMMLGAIRVESGDTVGGIALLERAHSLMPAHVHVLVNLGVAYSTAGRLPEARDALQAALKLDHRLAVAHNNLGNVLLDLGERDAAGKEYERALVARPNYPDALAGLARIAEQEHRLDDARRLSEKALGLAPQNLSAFLTRARVALRDGEAATAAAALEDMLRNGAPTATNRAIGEGYLGEAYDKLGRIDDAFAAFSRANQIQHGQHAHAFAQDRGPMAPDSVRRLSDFVAATDVWTWRDAPPPAQRAPVFLIGFPRSGTTLLDQILASHPRVSTLEERDSLADASRELILADHGFERWADLPDADIERLRSLYWQQVAAGLSGPPSGDVFVDKLPLNAIYLPLIHRLFPSAKIILAVRDPRDVVLSCFQQRFGMNAAMFQLLRLDTAAAYYDAVMTLVAASRAKLPLNLHVFKYEVLVADFDSEVGALLDFLELDWQDSVRDYATTAKTRTIATPSASQVVQPIYRSAQGKWRKYRRYLEPYLPTLEPWVRTFGYSPS
jgi:tetratricopeptide (TPR) repeat protein